MQTVTDRSAAVSALFKQEAHKLIDQLPDSAGWDELIYQAALHRAIERGLADCEAGRLIPVEALMKEFGVAETE